MHFCELAARLSLEKGDEGSTVPRKMLLYWFMLREAGRTYQHPLFRKSLAESTSALHSPRIGKEQCRVLIRDGRRALYERVAVLLCEVVEEGLADLCRWPVSELGRGGRHGWAGDEAVVDGDGAWQGEAGDGPADGGLRCEWLWASVSDSPATEAAQREDSDEEARGGESMTPAQPRQLPS